MHKRVENTSEREGAAEVAAITLCSLGYANGLMRNNNKKRSNELASLCTSPRASVYFRQPTKRGEKAATSGGGSPRVEPTAQGEGPEEEVNRASGQGEPGALTHRYRSRREDFFFVVFSLNHRSFVPTYYRSCFSFPLISRYRFAAESSPESLIIVPGN